MRSPEGIWAEWEISPLRLADRTIYTVLRNGWVVAEATYTPVGWRRTWKPMEAIPAEVLAELPDGARATLTQETT